MTGLSSLRDVLLERATALLHHHMGHSEQEGICLGEQVDRLGATEERCGEVESSIFDLFAHLGASEEQLDFPVLYASARQVHLHRNGVSRYSHYSSPSNRHGTSPVVAQGPWVAP